MALHQLSPSGDSNHILGTHDPWIRNQKRVWQTASLSVELDQRSCVTTNLGCDGPPNLTRRWDLPEEMQGTSCLPNETVLPHDPFLNGEAVPDACHAVRSGLSVYILSEVYLLQLSGNRRILPVLNVLLCEPGPQ